MSFGTKEQKIDFLRMALTLFAITAIVAAVLALANYFTAPIIANAAKERLDDSLRVLKEDAASFEELPSFPKEILTGGAKVPVTAVYAAKGADGAFIGFCIQVAPNGYSNTIDMIVATDREGAVSGVQILSIADTPGIGMKVESDEAFRNSVIGFSESISIVKKAPSFKDEVQVISGATVSSTAYLNGVNAAIDVANQMIEEVE